MADTADHQPVWRAPPPSHETLWGPPTNHYGGIPEPLYRLRMSILYNGHAHYGHPSRIFIYPTLSALQSAIKELNSLFNGAFPSSTMKQGGPARTGPTGDEKVMEGVEDGRTENVVLGYEEDGAEESFDEFMARVKGAEGKWKSECEGAGEE